MSLRFTTLMMVAFMCGGAICHAQSSVASSPTQPVPQATSESDEPVIVLARGAGYWDIGPVYRLLIYADGSITYIGTKNVKTKGVAKGRISRVDVQRLVKEFERINYSSLLDEYSDRGGCPSFLTDNSNASTILNIGGKRKAVFHDLGCLAEGEGFVSFPRGLTELENLIDEVVNSNQWIK